MKKREEKGVAMNGIERRQQQQPCLHSQSHSASGSAGCTNHVSGKVVVVPYLISV